MEYAYYKQQVFSGTAAMNETLVERFMLSNFFEKGMNNLYNAISFSASVE